MGFRFKNKSLDFGLERKKLPRIVEDPMEGLEDECKDYKKKGKKLILPKIRHSPTTLNFYETWLYTLSKSTKIYKYFTHKAFKTQALSRNKSGSMSPDSSWSVINRNCSKLSIGKTESLNTLASINSNKVKEKSSVSHRSQVFINLNFSSALKNSSFNRILNADKGNSEYFDRFKEITGTSGNVTRENLRDFLNLRYFEDVTECLIKWVYSGISANSENWIKDIQKFVILPDEKHFKLAFDFYDHNKDRFICNGDAFKAISVDKNRCFTQDIIRISKKLEEKLRIEYKPAVINTKVSAIHRLRAMYEEKKNKIPSQYIVKPNCLNFEEFCSIQFANNKPKIIIDLIEYISGIPAIDLDFSPVLVSRRNSEEIVKNLSEDYTFKEQLKSDPDYPYFLELLSLMSYFTLKNSQILLEKFNKMVCESYKTQKFLSHFSISQHWGNYFRVENEFINFSFYQFLAGYENFNISKISYLTKLKTLFTEETENFFAFCIYDRNKDGAITCDEVNDMLQTLPEHSFIYRECLILANEFIASIFGKRVKAVNRIEFSKFSEMIPKSILVQVSCRKEFKSALLAKGDARKNLSFCEIDQLDPKDVEYFLGYSHLNKKIELGEVTSEIVEGVEKCK